MQFRQVWTWFNHFIVYSHVSTTSEWLDATVFVQLYEIVCRKLGKIQPTQIVRFIAPMNFFLRIKGLSVSEYTCQHFLICVYNIIVIWNKCWLWHMLRDPCKLCVLLTKLLIEHFELRVKLSWYGKTYNQSMKDNVPMASSCSRTLHYQLSFSANPINVSMSLPLPCYLFDLI